jgi:hypothetical protein
VWQGTVGVWELDETDRGLRPDRRRSRLRSRGPGEVLEMWNGRREGGFEMGDQIRTKLGIGDWRSDEA